MVVTKHEDSTYIMDMPSSPFGPPLTKPSRRASWVSSGSGFSTSSPNGTNGPETPQSYGSSIPFEIPSMDDRLNLSFSSDGSLESGDSNANSFDGYDQKDPLLWSEVSNTAEVSSLASTSYVNANGFPVFHGQDPGSQHYKYNTTFGQHNYLGDLTGNPFDFHSMLGNTIIPSDIHSRGLYPSLLPPNNQYLPNVQSLYTLKQETSHYLDHHYSTPLPVEFGRSSSFDIKPQEKTPKATKTKHKKATGIVQTQSGGLISAQLAASGGFRCHLRITEAEAKKVKKSRGHTANFGPPDENGLYQCPAVFIHKEHLQRHIAQHSGIGRVTCDICKQTSSRPDNLRQHIRLHFLPNSNGRKIRLVAEQDGSVVFLDHLIAELGVEHIKEEYLRDQLEQQSEPASRRSRKVKTRRGESSDRRVRRLHS